jgi:hypothetical protein
VASLLMVTICSGGAVPGVTLVEEYLIPFDEEEVEMELVGAH